jgi:hypothetical protein
MNASPKKPLQHHHARDQQGIRLRFCILFHGRRFQLAPKTQLSLKLSRISRALFALLVRDFLNFPLAHSIDPH